MYRARLKSHSQVARIVQARPVWAAVVSNSSNKIHQTWERKFRPPLYSSALVPYGHCSMINDACSSYQRALNSGHLAITRLTPTQTGLQRPGQF